MGSFRHGFLNSSGRVSDAARRSACSHPVWFESIESRVLLSSVDPLDAGNDEPVISIQSEVPVITLKGNNTAIDAGDTTPSVDDFTDFWFVGTASGSVTRTFTIGNTGTSTLGLSGPDFIQISGAHASDFTVTTQPASSVNAAGSTTFTITFDPSAAGLRQATITIASNDPNTPNFTFDIQGTALETTELAGGLQIATTQQGAGRQVVDGDRLTVNYTGRLLTGSKFDSSLNPGRSPFQFTIGSGQVIQGWEKGILGMKVGETRVLIIPAALAYGSTPRENIPANSDLIFEVTLLAIAGAQIEVRGNATVIAHNDNTPSSTDNTDFGSLAINHTTGTSKSFTVIMNKGEATLKLTGIPAIQISGPNAADFTVSQPVSGTNLVTFNVHFRPRAGDVGTRTATIAIPSNDPDTPTFNFTIAGAATAEVVPANATVSVADASVTEGNSGTTMLNFIVTLSQTRDAAVTANFRLQALSASANSDYTPVQGQITFAPGQTQQTISVPIKGDRQVEADETLMLVLSNLAGSSVVLGRAVAAGKIISDDPPTISITARGRATEDQAGDDGKAGFTLQRSVATSAPLVVTIAVSGTATAGSDFDELPASVTIPANKRSVFVPLAVIDDLLGESAETVIVTLQSNAAAYSLATARSSATLSISDNEPVASISAVRDARESSAVGNRLGQFRVSLNRVADVAVTLQYTVSGVAAMGADYEALTLRVTIAAGARSALINVTPINDTQSEGPETLTLTLLDLPSSGYALSSVNTGRLATIRIIDND